MHYLDPRNDVVFKHIFGENKDILMDLLNALLPISTPIVELEYLPVEQVPEIPVFKNTIVDIKCFDAEGRIFIVEMQLNWTRVFQQRVLFNGCKAYVRQLDKGENYELLYPVYALSLVNDIYDRDSSEYYHHYKIVNVKDANRNIQGLEFVFIELPKFKPHENQTIQDLWLRFFREVNEKTDEPPADLLQRPEIKKAIRLAREAALTPAQLEYYDAFWAKFSQEKTLIEQLGKATTANAMLISENEILKEEKDKAEAEKQKAEAEKQKAEAALQNVLSAEKAKQRKAIIEMHAAGLTLEQMKLFSGLAIEDIEQYLQDNNRT